MKMGINHFASSSKYYDFRFDRKSIQFYLQNVDLQTQPESCVRVCVWPFSEVKIQPVNFVIDNTRIYGSYHIGVCWRITKSTVAKTTNATQCLFHFVLIDFSFLSFFWYFSCVPTFVPNPLSQQISFWPFLLIPLLVVGVIAIITLILLPFFIHQQFSRKYDENTTNYVVATFIFFFCWSSKSARKNVHHFIFILTMNTVFMARIQIKCLLKSNEMVLLDSESFQISSFHLSSGFQFIQFISFLSFCQSVLIGIFN